MWNNPLAIDLDAVADAAHDAFGGFLRRQHEVLLRQPVPRMHDAIRDLAVIREEQQPLRVPVEPANREQPGLAGKSSMTVRRSRSSLVVVMKPDGLFITTYRNGWRRTSLPSTWILARRGSTRVPSWVTTCPSTETLPD